MDSYSGSFPLDFVSFYLGMTTEAQDAASILPDRNLDERTDKPTVEEIDPSTEMRPLSNLSSSSGATEESLTAYAERTLHNLGVVDTNLDVSFLEAPDNSGQKAPDQDTNAKASVSDVIERGFAPQKRTKDYDPANILESTDKPTRDTLQSDFFATDTSKVEDLTDSEGVFGVPNRAASSIVGSENPATQDEGNFEPQPSTSYASPRIPEQLAANGRVVLCKFFAKTEQVTIPMGHPTVAFTEPLAILRTTSETVQSSVHVMKAILMHAAQGGIQKLSNFRETLQRTTSASQHVSDSPDGGTDTEGYSTDGYTSGAIPSDEDIANFDVSPSTHFAPAYGVTDPLNSEDPTKTTLSPAQFGVPSPGFSEGDYAPLSSIRASPSATPTGRSPPCKRRWIISKPGNVMKPAYFKGIQWTRIFVTGPLDHVQNKYKFYCQTCKAMCRYSRKDNERLPDTTSRKLISERPALEI